MIELTFWLCAFLLVYPYALYPLVLRWLARRTPVSGATGGGDLPTLTVIVSAHNEAAVIAHKVESTLAVDYPAERLSVVVVSDASTDETNAIVARLAAADPRVRLLALAEHRGKTAGLNIAMESIASQLVVFTDANAIFDRAALRELATCFADPAVGYVVGAALYEQHEDTSAGRSEGLYWRYELAIKENESACGSVVGGDGAIYAIRRELYRPLADEDINDFVNPLQIIAAGYRGVFRAAARAYEDPANDYAKEFRRRRRIVCRSWGALLRYWGPLGLARHRRFVFMLVSHKVIRWFTLAWFALTGMSAVLLTARGAGLIYVAAVAVFGLFLALAAKGRRLARAGAEVPGHLSAPYYFLLSNWAALLGIWDYLRGNRYVTWQHARQPGQ